MAEGSDILISSYDPLFLSSFYDYVIVLYFGINKSHVSAQTSFDRHNSTGSSNHCSYSINCRTLLVASPFHLRTTMADVGETGTNMEQMIQKLTEAVEKTQGSHMISLVKKVTRSLEPERFQPLSVPLYKNAVNEILGSDGKLGLLVVDRNTALFGTLSGRGNTREYLYEFKSNVAWHSALDYGGLRRNYIQIASKLAPLFFVDPKTKEPNVAGLILAATAPYMTDLCSRDMFDPRLEAKIVNAVYISCGGEKGFNEVVAEILSFQP